MCGIAGIIRSSKPAEEALLGEMLDCIKHRGPEDEGRWFSANKKVALGQRRLAIIDLSPGGHQPMVSDDGRFSITFNGEIYNYLEVKAELEKIGVSFKTKSDTEVLLKAYIAWGEKCLLKLNGMFAFAVWDEREQTLFAARDPLGEKPFKYYWDGASFIFASELKAILRDKTIAREPDWQAVDLAMTYRFVPAPLTGFKNIKKLPAGNFLVWKNGEVLVKPYWQAIDHAKENTTRSVEEWKTILWDTFKDSIKGRLISDVPVGAFLSGGLDSSSVVAAMSEISPGKVKTFSVGLKDQPDSEIPFAKLVADRFKTDHTEIIVDPKVIELLPQLVGQFEEPFFDNAAVPTMVMAKETKKHVTVVLTGDGGDELFGGYSNHSFYKRLAQYQAVPSVLREQAIPGMLGFLASATGNEKMRKTFYRSELLGHDLVQAYVDFYAIWKKELKRSHIYPATADLYTDELKRAIDLNKSETLMAEWLGLGKIPGYGHQNRAMLADIVGRLGDNYLMKVDFASMIYALENRAPFLDRRLVELALSIPEKYKVHNGDVKWIWKQIMIGKIPDAIIARRKMGFGIPIGAWMRNELYEYVRDTLIRSDSVLYRHFKKEVIVRMLEDHKSGKADYSNHLWCLLLIEEWLKTFLTV